MVCIPSQNTFLLEIPKSGSRSLVYSAHSLGQMAARGHHTIKTSFDRAEKQVGLKPNPTVIAVIRDPEERFISAMNFYYTQRAPKLDEAMALVKENNVAFCHPFYRQSYFFDDPGIEYTLDLYPMEHIDKVFERIGVEPTRQNARRYRWTAEQIKEHPLFPEIMEAYRADYKLREAAWQNPRLGLEQDKPSTSRSPRKPRRARSKQKQSTRSADSCVAVHQSTPQTSPSPSQQENGKTAAPASDE